MWWSCALPHLNWHRATSVQNKAELSVHLSLSRSPVTQTNVQLRRGYCWRSWLLFMHHYSWKCVALSLPSLILILILILMLIMESFKFKPLMYFLSSLVILVYRYLFVTFVNVNLHKLYYIKFKIPFGLLVIESNEWWCVFRSVRLIFDSLLVLGQKSGSLWEIKL